MHINIGLRRLISACILGGITLVLVFVFGADSSKTHTGVEKIPRLVKVVKVKSLNGVGRRIFPGVVQADYETDLAFQVGGPLTKMDVKIGREVKPGELIARIDQRDFRVAVKRLEANISQENANLRAMQKGARKEEIVRLEAELTAVKAQLAEAQSNYNRYEALYKKKAVAKATFDTAKTAYENAQARVTMAKKALEIGRTGARQEDIEAMKAKIRLLRADLESAQNALADTELLSPMHGMVNKKYVENFQTVTPGQPIVSLLDLSSLVVKTSLPQHLIAQNRNWTDFTCTLDTYPGIVIPAELKEIGQKTEGAGMSYPLTVRLKPPGEITILPGMAAEVSIGLVRPQNGNGRMTLPNSAVFADQKGKPCVWKIDTASMTVEKTPIATGEIVEEGIVIEKGLTPGDLVVGAGARLLLDGEKVRLLEDTEGRDL